MIVRGPLSSRRLGRYLAIYNFPQKVCTYSCVYCQGGHTAQLEFERIQYYQPMEIVKEVRTHLAKEKESGETFDFLAFIPDGEPTQDANLGKEIEHLKAFNIKIAVMTNSSLIWREDVRNDLLQADWISLKIDSINEDAWRKINRPHRTSRLATIIEGIVEFSRQFKGTLVTETMLVGGVNDSDARIEETAKFISKLKPKLAYLSIPVKRPTEDWAKPPPESAINRCYQTFSYHVSKVEYLIGYEFVEMSVLGNVRSDLLAILGQHPLKEEDARNFLLRGGMSVNLLKDLVREGEIVETSYRGSKYYVRKMKLEWDMRSEGGRK